MGYAVGVRGGALFGGAIARFLFVKSTLYRLPEPQAWHLVMSMPVILRIRSGVEMVVWVCESLGSVSAWGVFDVDNEAELGDDAGKGVFVSSLQRATFSFLLRLPSNP